MANEVTLYENRDFGGQSVVVGEGNTRFSTPASFNDTASSIRVSPGWCAVLYEEADANGGYGIWVDLLEDCADLSRYNFDKKTSCVRVFRVQKDQFVYVRNSISNGEFVAGHWERQRARPLPPNPLAVVAPPAPPSSTPPTEGLSEGPVVRDHRGEPPHGVPPAHDAGFGGIVHDHRKSNLKHIFVLMLENRSFDHMLGFSGITGTDAQTGQPTTINGLRGDEFNTHAGKNYVVSRDASDVMPNGPGHNFADVLEQLCGDGVIYPSGGAYPPVHNSGFVSAYARQDPNNPDGAMKCFPPDRVPILTALAKEFVVCDNWFSSMPGPTEPNRMFVHAATSGKFDNSPSTEEIIKAMGVPGGGFAFMKGTIFARLSQAGVKFRIYADDDFPNVAELDGISVVFDIDDFEDFADDVSSPSYDAVYTFIEPNYDVVPSGDFGGGNSQHPSGSVAAGELLIKRTYEAIRKSPLWNSSVLIITWDEHGGFYDHVPPPAARGTGERGRTYGFTFEQLGPRVPAVVVSPLIPKNLIEHRQLEHSSIPSTLITMFNLQSLTVRASMSSGINHLATLVTPRTDAPMTLPNPVGGISARMVRAPLAAAIARNPSALLSNDPHGNLAAVLHSAVSQHLKVAPPSERNAILTRVQALKTHADLINYMKEVSALVRAAKAKAGVRRSATVRIRP